MNIRINGEWGNESDFGDLHDKTIGGVTLHCTGEACTGGEGGIVSLSGVIDDFAIGGQEFFVDGVCPANTEKAVPGLDVLNTDTTMTTPWLGMNRIQR